MCSRFFNRPKQASADRAGVASPLAAELCATCLHQIAEVESPLCSICGLPFAGRQGPDHVCEKCIRAAGFFTRARSALVYNEPLMRVIHCFKYGGQIQLAKPLGEILRAAFERYWDPQGIDLMVPVPLHPRRMRKRGFNQAYLMMRGWGLPVAPRPPQDYGPLLQRDLIIRIRDTQPQTTLDRKQRVKNIKNAFALTDCDTIRNRTILLVDDVYTTGATAGECARLLMDGGARQVDILTVARAVVSA